MTDVNLKGLFQKYAKTLQRMLASRTRDPQLAADLTQESFLRLAEQSREAPIDNVPGYLFRTASNLLIDHRRQQARRRTDNATHEVLALVEDEAPDAERQLDAHQRLLRIHQALAELPPRTRQIFTLNRLQGLSYAEVAKRLGISDSSVQKHLARALQHLTERLRDA